MHLVFVDDSEQQNPVRAGVGHLVALGAAIVPESKVGGYADDLAAIRSELGIPESEELKWKPPRKSFLAQAGGEVNKALRTRMLEAAIAREITTVVVIIDHSQAYRSCTRAEVGREALKWLYERVTICLAGREDVGIVVADKPGGGAADEGKWLAETLSLTNHGTEYVEAGRIVMPILTAPSHHLPQLQLADLVTAATTAAVAGHPAARELAPLLRELAHKNALHYIGGAGVVLWPGSLRNLLHWVFGEDTYAKVAMNTGWSLPWMAWRYATSDGLPRNT